MSTAIRGLTGAALMVACVSARATQPLSSGPHGAADALSLNPPASTQPISTDRPDFTESTLTVPRGRLQLEGGYTFVNDDADRRRVSEQTVPELLMRAGLTEALELRVGWTGMSMTEAIFRERNDAGRTVVRKDHDDGATDMTVGVKVHVLDQHGVVPGFGLIPELGLPTGSRTKTAGDVEPRLKLAWAYALTEKIGLSGNVNLGAPVGTGGHFFQTEYSLSLAAALAERLGMYAEYYAACPNDRGSDCAHRINGGFTFGITDDLQFDVRVGMGLNSEAEDFFTGAGFAIRF